MTMPLIDIVVVRFDTFVCTLILEMNNAILSPKYNIFGSGVLCCRNFERLFPQLSCSRSVREPYLRASYHVYKIGCLLVCGISLPAAQLFLIAIENILRGSVGNLTSRHQSAREETEENKKIIKNCYICSILKRLNVVNRSQDSEKKKKEHSRI